MIATNADKIIAARLKGQRPADMVMVALDDAFTSRNPIVYAKADVAYDWRWTRGLDICIRVKDADDWGHMAKDIALQRPAYLCIWNQEGSWGARVWLVPTTDDVRRPVRTWRYDIDFSLWLDFQNTDFINHRVYSRDEHGMPYAVN